MRVLSDQPRFRFRPPGGDPGPRRVPPEILPGLGGLALGAPSAYLGVQLADRYGPRLVQAAIRKAVPLVAEGYIRPETALRALPYLTDKTMQLQAGGLALGLAGFTVGAAVIWSCLED